MRRFTNADMIKTRQWSVVAIICGCVGLLCIVTDYSKLRIVFGASAMGILLVRQSILLWKTSKDEDE